MCGIVGIWSKDNSLIETLPDTVRKMQAALLHRGPDDGGIWFDRSKGLSLGHRRLAIQDLSSSGKQPMCTKSGRYIIIYNGEIYNSSKIKDEINSSSAFSFRWSGESDTEVLLNAIEIWGLKKAVSKCIGMFAFALWDNKNDELHLVVDRVGIKPLYFGHIGNDFVFSSELKALKKHPNFSNEISISSLALFFKYNYIPVPYSIYNNIFKLAPGSILTLSCQHQTPSIESYWPLSETIISSRNNPFCGSYEEAASSLEDLISDSIQMRMISDVPLGAFLSGGIDSSLVVSLMQNLSSNPVRTFSIGFEEEKYNEAKFAKDVAKFIGTDHSELYVSSKQALDVIPYLPQIYDEPFADSSQIPTYLVSEMTKKSVTVALTGDGGDELFCGYSRYILADMTWNKICMIPKILKYPLQGILRTLPENFLNKLYSPISPFVPESLKVRNFGKNIHRFASLMNYQNEKSLYFEIMSNFKNPHNIINGFNGSFSKISQEIGLEGMNFKEWMMFQDMSSYLPGNILTKVDRASMAVSLEARVPLLDHRIVSFAWSLPIEWKYSGNQSKSILRKILYKHVPAKMVDRPKAGFTCPIKNWLSGPLKEWCESLIQESRLKEEGFLNYKLVKSMWNDHQNGTKDWHTQLWSIMMFQAWLEQNI